MYDKKIMSQECLQNGGFEIIWLLWNFCPEKFTWRFFVDRTCNVNPVREELVELVWDVFLEVVADAQN